MMKHGLHDCVIPYNKMYSDEIMDETLFGKRALISSIFTDRKMLSERVINKRKCGFYLSKVKYEPKFMLYNKKFNKELKERIDFRYSTISC